MLPGEDYDRDNLDPVFYRRVTDSAENFVKEGSLHALVKCNRDGTLMKDRLPKLWGRFRRFARLVGKLVAAERMGREKRLDGAARKKKAEEEKIRLQMQAKFAAIGKLGKQKKDEERKEEIRADLPEKIDAKVAEQEE